MNPKNAPIMDDVVLEWQGAKSADYGELMNKQNQYAYVLEHHKWAITQLKGEKEGLWKTYYEANGQRHGITRKSRDELIDWLYNYYQQGEGANKTFKAVYDEMIDYKLDVELRSPKTMTDYRCRYNEFMRPLERRKIHSITENDLREWIVQDVLPMRPGVAAFERALTYVNHLFKFAVRQRYIAANPMEFIRAKEYEKHCDHHHKAEEDTYFTEEEIGRIRKEMLRLSKNPRALIALLNIEMGMRAAEAVALHWDDVHDDYVSIHRQQIRHDETSPITFEEVDYTKDTRCKTGSDRRFPITPRIREILELCRQLPGDSVYIFHDKDGRMIAKDSYEQHLRRTCQRLGLTKTNNHAFRKSLNNLVLIPAGIPANERAALLGHSVRTNEQHYSHRRMDRLSEIGAAMAEARRNDDLAAAG